ncbi:unnamed protein product, partial [Arabidopsis halleri]
LSPSLSHEIGSNRGEVVSSDSSIRHDHHLHRRTPISAIGELGSANRRLWLFQSGNFHEAIGEFPSSNRCVSFLKSVCFLHQSRSQGCLNDKERRLLKRFTDFAAVRKEIQDETDRETGCSKAISSVPIHLSIYSLNVVNLTLIDLPGLTTVVVDGQSDSIVKDIENMVRSYIEKVNEIK